MRVALLHSLLVAIPADLAPECSLVYFTPSYRYPHSCQHPCAKSQVTSISFSERHHQARQLANCSSRVLVVSSLRLLKGRKMQTASNMQKLGKHLIFAAADLAFSMAKTSTKPRNSTPYAGRPTTSVTPLRCFFTFSAHRRLWRWQTCSLHIELRRADAAQWAFLLTVHC